MGDLGKTTRWGEELPGGSLRGGLEEVAVGDTGARGAEGEASLAGRRGAAHMGRRVSRRGGSRTAGSGKV